MAAAVMFWGGPAHLSAAKVVVIGDSLSAEYEAIPDFPGLDNPTAYAQITAGGWESMSWVEVLGRLRADHFDFGEYRGGLLGWGPLRFSGYQYNFAIPGFRAAQYEDIVNSSWLSNPQFLLERSALEEVLREEAGRVVIWLGPNEIRANYGFLYEGGDPSSLIANLVHDLSEVIDFVLEQKSSLQVVLVTLPDLGAAPDKRAAHPDPGGQARATAAIVRANEAIRALAAAKGIALADAFAKTEPFVQGGTLSFGPVALINEASQDNHPHFAFARDGLHPNTPLQIEMARTVIEAFNTAFQAAISQISDAEALSFLGAATNQPYSDWRAAYGADQDQPGDDPDQDGLNNLVEYAFDLDPTQSSRLPVMLRREAGELELTYRWNDSPQRAVKVVPQVSADLLDWRDLPAARIRQLDNGAYAAVVPIATSHAFLRLSVRQN